MKQRIPNALRALPLTLAIAVLPLVAHAGPISNSFQNAAGSAGYSTANASTALPLLIGNIVEIAISLVGLIFFVQIVYAGYLWMTARGEREQAEKAQETIRRSVIGLIVTLAAYSISLYIVHQLEVKV